MTNRRTYLFEKCNTLDGDIGYGYIVNFYVCYDEESGMRYTKDISVIECMGCNSKQPIVKKKKSQHSKRKPTNASRYSYCNNKKFQKFVKEFMREQKNKARKSIDTY